MSQRWVTVFSGAVWQALGVQARLEAEGILTFVPDQNLRAIDPYLTGGNVFALDVLVPEDTIGAAREIVRLEIAPSENSDEMQRDADAALRLGWWTIFFPPIAFVLGLRYLTRVHRTGIKPAGHRFNVLTIAASLLLSLAYGFILGARAFH